MALRVYREPIENEPRILRGNQFSLGTLFVVSTVFAILMRYFLVDLLA